MVAAARRVGPEDGDEDGQAHLLELRVAVERRAVAAAVRVDLLLHGQLHAGAVEHPHEGEVHALGQIGHAQDVVRLAGDPRAGHDLVVGGDDHRRLAVDLADAVDDAGGPLHVVLGIVNRVQRAPGALVHQVVEALPGGHLSAGLELLSGNAGGLHLCDLLVEHLLHLADLRHALGAALQRLGFSSLPITSIFSKYFLIRRPPFRANVTMLLYHAQGRVQTAMVPPRAPYPVARSNRRFALSQLRLWAYTPWTLFNFF